MMVTSAVTIGGGRRCRLVISKKDQPLYTPEDEAQWNGRRLNTSGDCVVLEIEQAAAKLLD